MVHGISFDIEEHFQVAAFDSAARRRHWESQESRVERNTHYILDLLAERGVRSTMFVLGWVAERHPGLVRCIVQDGHELGSHGYAHELIAAQTPEVFREDIHRAKAILEDVSGTPVLGYRAPTFSITKETIWALPILVQEGFLYDSSIVPVVHDFYGIPNATPTIHALETEHGTIWEVPPTTVAFGPVKIPVAGGGYFRLFPYRVLKPLLHRASSDGNPLIMYLHPWELDSHQPRMQGPWLSQFRHYHNLGKVPSRLKQLLKDFTFGPIGALLHVGDKALGNS
jgi:polysaccharide deacetylase family protein (PEP-CTERM system associated)